MRLVISRAQSANHWKLEMSENFLGLFDQETEVVTLAPGEALFEKGEPGRLMYVVKTGNLQTSAV
jgi:CRP-like cAMP-binding protein